MKKDTQNLVILLLVIGFFMYAPQLTGPQAVVTDGGPVQVDGVSIVVGTPTVEWYVEDIVTDESLVFGWEAYRVTINGTKKDYDSDDTTNASMGDIVEVCLLPNSTYYAACETTTITGSTTKITVETYKLGSLSAYWNNDTENSTTRNSVTAQDALVASDTDTPTFCVAGATANASFGAGKFAVIFDYNSYQLAAPPSWSAGTLNNALIPATYVPDTNMGAGRVAYEVTGVLSTANTVCGTVTIVNSLTSDYEQSNVDTTALDYAGFRNTVTDALEFGYAGLTTGSDTNSATNVNTEYFTT